VAEVLRRAQHQKQQFTEKLTEQQEWIEARLAREIERTNATEAEMGFAKTKFAEHLLRLEGLQKAAAEEHQASADAAAASVTVRTWTQLLVSMPKKGPNILGWLCTAHQVNLSLSKRL
jgi:hypothetical protein